MSLLSKPCLDGQKWPCPNREMRDCLTRICCKCPFDKSSIIDNFFNKHISRGSAVSLEHIPHNSCCTIRGCLLDMARNGATPARSPEPSRRPEFHLKLTLESISSLWPQQALRRDTTGPIPVARPHRQRLRQSITGHHPILAWTMTSTR